jgi:hypothetical protein
MHRIFIILALFAPVAIYSFNPEPTATADDTLAEIRRLTKDLQDWDPGIATSPNFNTLGPTQSNFLVKRLTAKAEQIRRPYNLPKGDPFICLNVRLSKVNRVNVLLGEPDPDGATHWLWIRGQTEKDLFDGLEQGIKTILENPPTPHAPVNFCPRGCHCGCNEGNPCKCTRETEQIRPDPATARAVTP